MRTLFISNVVSDQLDTGCLQRVFHMLRAVAEVSDVTFVAAAPGGQWNGPATPFRSLCKEMYFYPRESFAGWNWDRDSSLAIRRLKIGSRLVSTEEPELFQWFRSEAGAALIEQLCERHFDLVWVERFYTLSMLPAKLKARVMVDLDDLEHRKLGRELSIENSAPKKALMHLEYAKLRRFERNLTQLPYEFVVCSEADKQILGGGKKVWVIPNGVEIPQQHNDIGYSQQDPVILFIGVMDYAPNCDAVEFFAGQVMPLVCKQVPNAKFMIVGRNPTAAVRALDSGQTVCVTGTVPEVEPYLRQASVVVAPLRVGGGTRIKILEAMAHHRPVLATTIGAEGLDVESGRDLLLADSPSRLADACVLLLQDPIRRRELAARAFDFVRTKHDWSNIQDRVQQIVIRQDVKDRRIGKGSALSMCSATSQVHKFQ